LQFLIVTCDRDALDSEPYRDISADQWNCVGKAKVFYAPPGNRSLTAFVRLIRETPHDVLYLNSFFDPVFTLLPLAARAMGLVPRRPCVIAPRGEFSPGALTLKTWKKRPYVWLARTLRLYSGLTWQASSDQEAEDIQRVLGDVASRILVAPNLPSLCGVMRTDHKARTEGGPLRVVFLSRITPKKNLDFALQVLSRVKTPLVFNIYGPIRDKAYWQVCQRSVSKMPET